MAQWELQARNIEGLEPREDAGDVGVSTSAESRQRLGHWHRQPVPFTQIHQFFTHPLPLEALDQSSQPQRHRPPAEPRPGAAPPPQPNPNGINLWA